MAADSRRGAEAGSPWSAVLWAALSVGWAVGLVSTFPTDHFNLSGRRRVILFERGRPYSLPPFRVRGLYRAVRLLRGRC